MVDVGGNPKTLCLARAKGKKPSFLTLLKCFTSCWTLWTLESCPGSSVTVWNTLSQVSHLGERGLRSLSPNSPPGIAGESCRGP